MSGSFWYDGKEEKEGEMTFDEYQKQARTTNSMPNDSPVAPYYFGLGLTGESGEVAEKLKKVLRNHDGDFSKLDLDDFKKELGDVLWYLAMLAQYFSLSFDDVAQANLVKLADRKTRAVIKSTGDNR